MWMRVSGTVLVVALLLGPASTHAQAEPSSEGGRAIIASLSALEVGLATWISATPHGGFWATEMHMEAPEAWLGAIAVAGSTFAVTYLAGPTTGDGIQAQMFSLALGLGATAILGLGRLAVSVGADSCNEVCHKLLLAMPMFVASVFGMAIGAIADAIVGPPVAVMTGPLTLRF